MQPMLATRVDSVDEIPRGAGWSYEVKWDGVRVLLDTRAGSLRLVARSGRDVTVTYPELAPLARLPDVLLDGEVVVMADGVPSFEALAERMNVRDGARAARLAARAPATYVAFDVLAHGGTDLVRRPLTERRAVLDRLGLPSCAQRSPVYPDLDVLWDVTRDHGLEGVVAKRLTAPYQPGRRSPDWLKAVHRATRAAAVVGWRAEHARQSRLPTGGPLGAVLLGAPDAAGRWRYLGKAGSGLGGRRGAALAEVLAPHHRATSPLDEPVPEVDARAVTWCDPAVVVDVGYLQRTRSGRLRQPVVRGHRTDTTVDPWED